MGEHAEFDAVHEEYGAGIGLRAGPVRQVPKLLAAPGRFHVTLDAARLVAFLEEHGRRPQRRVAHDAEVIGGQHPRDHHGRTCPLHQARMRPHQAEQIRQGLREQDVQGQHDQAGGLNEIDHRRRLAAKESDRLADALQTECHEHPRQEEPRPEGQVPHAEPLDAGQDGDGGDQQHSDHDQPVENALEDVRVHDGQIAHAEGFDGLGVAHGLPAGRRGLPQHHVVGGIGQRSDDGAERSGQRQPPRLQREPAAPDVHDRQDGRQVDRGDEVQVAQQPDKAEHP